MSEIAIYQPAVPLCAVSLAFVRPEKQQARGVSLCFVSSSTLSSTAGQTGGAEPDCGGEKEESGMEKVEDWSQVKWERTENDARCQF
jgi:hypothetical protein